MADFEEHRELLDELGIQILAMSVDSRREAAETVERLGLGYPVGYGLEVDEVERTIGAFVDRDRGILQATSFILRDDAVAHATYSSGPLGRLRAENVLSFVRHAEQA